jgi:mRNA interferase YafQ
MRTLQPTKAYRRDYRRIKSNPRYKNIDDFLNPVLEMLAHDRPLPVRNRDHDLSGNWSDCRECHVRPEVVMMEVCKAWTAVLPRRRVQRRGCAESGRPNYRDQTT